MAAQPQSGATWVAVGTVGTNVVSPNPINLQNIIIAGTYVGTVGFFDAATAAGTAAGNQIISLGLPATAIPQFIPINVSCRTGLVYAATGTPNITFTYD